MGSEREIREIIICILLHIEAKDFAGSHVLLVLLLWVRGAGHCRLALSPVALPRTPCGYGQVLLVSKHLRCSEFAHGLEVFVFPMQCAHRNPLRSMSAPLALRGAGDLWCLAFSLGEHVWCIIAAKQAALCHQSPATIVLDTSTSVDVGLECGESHKWLVPSGARSRL